MCEHAYLSKHDIGGSGDITLLKIAHPIRSKVETRGESVGARRGESLRVELDGAVQYRGTMMNSGLLPKGESDQCPF
jgi:hypothetical protein